MHRRLERRLEEIRKKGNYRQLRYIKPVTSTQILYNGKIYLNLCSNSYLSLHAHPDILKAAKDVIDEYGAGTCSSRSVSGSIDLYGQLEKMIARYKGYRRGLIFSNGYMANIAIISTLTDGNDVIFSDELNHSSLIDAMRLSRARTVIYKHRDINDLEKKIKRERSTGKRFVVTESIFSMDGDIAPLSDIFELRERYGFHIILDDAHGTGIFGQKGTGVEELFGLSGSMDVHMATFGKALGSFGAFVLSDEIVINFLVNRARTFMYTTALPASSLAVAMTALEMIRQDTTYKDELWKNIDYMRRHLNTAGLDLKESVGPIIPIVVGEDAKTLRMQENLMRKGLFLQAIRPPTVPEGTSRLRLTVVRGFTQDDMDYTIETIIDAGKKMKLI
ncbi:MAG: 8-amino-7-oxononanoate synthase [Syntrophorhabdus sp. PtaU1.Bin058]|nr:MAG: 8-amino-7-oxononanoate synthase [Syntrophorhabdus sp. PtaU1.Bin058]